LSGADIIRFAQNDNVYLVLQWSEIVMDCWLLALVDNFFNHTGWEKPGWFCVILKLVIISRQPREGLQC